MNASEEILIPSTGEDARTPNIVSNIASGIDGSVAGEYMGEDARTSIIEGSVPVSRWILAAIPTYGSTASAPSRC
jgi:hypothetical protein